LINNIPNDEKSKLENSILLEKIKILNERINQIITKADSDLIDEKISNLSRYTGEINQDQDIQYKGNVDLNKKRRIISNLLSDKYDEYITASNSLSDLMVFSSNEFLRNQLNLSDEEIVKIKPKGDPYDELHELLDNEVLNRCHDATPMNKEESKKKENIIEVIKKQAENVNKSLINKNNKNSDITGRTLEKNVEEDLQNEVFNLVKGMNKYAKNFTNVLETDNKVFYNY
jgi:hypothetical protein